jgi:hypothetical protein
VGKAELGTDSTKLPCKPRHHTRRWIPWHAPWLPSSGWRSIQFNHTSGGQKINILTVRACTWHIKARAIHASTQSTTLIELIATVAGRLWQSDLPALYVPPNLQTTVTFVFPLSHT